MNLMRNLGGGVGISIAITLLERRTQLHTDRLVYHATMFDKAFRDRLAGMTDMFMSHGSGPGGGSAGGAHTQALLALNHTLQIQAQMLAYLDVFKIMAIGCLAVVGLVLFLRNISRSDKGPPAGH